MFVDVPIKVVPAKYSIVLVPPGALLIVKVIVAPKVVLLPFVGVLIEKVAAYELLTKQKNSNATKVDLIIKP